MSLLAEAPPGRHFAQIHRQTESQDRRRDTLTDSALEFVETGVRNDHSVLIITTADREQRLFDRLAAAKIHPKALCNSGQMAVLRPDEIVVQFVKEGVPEWAEFRSLLAPVLSRLQPYGSGVRIYSELADTLWRAGNTEAAIRLEDFWNALASAYSFSLYCAYTMDTHSEHAYAGPMEELGRTHSDILGTPEDERFGVALDRASKDIFGISLTQMAGMSRTSGARRFPSGQRTMLWVKRNLPLTSAQLVQKARQYFQDGHA